MAIDLPRALEGYKVAAEAGDAYGQFLAGRMYYNGHGVDQDMAEAFKWYEMAAAQDQPDAVAYLGHIHAEGFGVVTPSIRRGREYLQRAVKLGEKKAVKELEELAETIQQVILLFFIK